MAATTTRPPRLKNGTRVHVRSDHPGTGTLARQACRGLTAARAVAGFAEECDAVIRKAEPDHGQGDVGWWLYRVEVTAGQTPKDAQHDDGTVWVWDFEVQPL